MIASLKPLAKTSRSLHACLLACVLALVPTSSLLASDVLADCLEPECIEAAQSRTVLHRIFRRSDEPVLHFLANKNTESAALLLANLSALKGKPLLALLAIYQTPTPTPEQRAAIRTLAGGHAFLQLTLLPSASTPEERDLILKNAVESENWSEGYIEIVRLVKKALADVDAEILTQLMDQDSAIVWSTANTKDQRVIEQNQAHRTGISAAIIEMPAYESITSVCKELRLLETIHRRDLCKELGQKMERRSNTLITVLVGLAIQKYAAEDAVETAQIETRKTAWREFPKLVLETFLPADYETLTMVERAKIDHKILTRMLDEGEVPALIKLYEQHAQTDDAPQELIHAVRSQQ